MAKAKRLPSGNWRVLVYSHTETVTDKKGNKKEVRRYISFTDPNKKEAEFQAVEYLRNRKEYSRSIKILFSDAIDKYINLKSNILSPSTIRGYRIMQRNAFPLLLNHGVEELSRTDKIQAQINTNAAKYAPKSLRNQMGLISAVLKANKCAVPEITLPTAEKHSIPVPTKTEIEKILQIITTAPKIECQVLLALTCSLRQSEIAAITPSNVCGDIVKIHGALVPDEHNQLVYKESNKTEDSTRKAKMSPYLSSRLHELCKGKDKDEYIFSGTPNALLKNFKSLLAKNDIFPYTVHALRHAFAALMHSRGLPDQYIMEMGGWSSDHVMKSVYMYTFEEEVNKAKEEVNSYFDAFLKQKK